MMANRKTPTSKTYAVAGKTLADINKDIEKKGPVDPNDGKRFAGSCKGEIGISLTDKDLAYTTTEGSSPVEVTAKVKGGAVTSGPTITMPKLASDKGLSDAAKKEWKRFIGATQLHEDGHADSFYALAVKMTEEIVAMSATGTGKDEKAAQVAAGKALFGQISAAFGGSTISQRIKDDVKAFDGKTNHGATQGAVLKTSVT